MIFPDPDVCAQWRRATRRSEMKSDDVIEEAEELQTGAKRMFLSTSVPSGRAVTASLRTLAFSRQSCLMLRPRAHFLKKRKKYFHRYEKKKQQQFENKWPCQPGDRTSWTVLLNISRIKLVACIMSWSRDGQTMGNSKHKDYLTNSTLQTLHPNQQ